MCNFTLLKTDIVDPPKLGDVTRYRLGSKLSAELHNARKSGKFIANAKNNTKWFRRFVENRNEMPSYVIFAPGLHSELWYAKSVCV